jgi:hypothetical protein
MPRRKVQTSGVVASATKKARKPAPQSKEELAERFKDFPAIDILERRFNDPSDPGSQPILLKDESPNCCVNTEHQQKLKPGATHCHLCKRPARKWYVRYFNLGQEGRNAQMRGKGYVPVAIKELMDSDDIGDLYRSEKDAYVRRGDRGQEILAKQPLEAYLYIKRLQYDERMSRAISAKATRSDLAESAGKDLGDEAGQSIHDGAIQVESMTRHKVTLGEEAELEAEVGSMVD